MTPPRQRRALPAMLLCLCLCALLTPARSQSAANPAPASNDGFNCSANATYPCQAYALYRAGFGGASLDLAAIGDLFSASRFMVAHANNLSATAVPVDGQSLLVPLQCGCPSRSPNSYAPTQYQINAGDTFWIVSTAKFQNLTHYVAVERVNPTLVPTNLDIGQMVTFPIFCQCPTAAVNATALVTYVMQPGDTYASVATAFAVDAQSLVSLNGPEQVTQNLSTPAILVPLRRQVPQWLPPIVRVNNVSTTPASPPPSSTPAPTVVTKNRDGVVTGLAIGLGIVGGMWLLQMLLLACLWRRLKSKGRRGEAVASGDGGEGGRLAKIASGGGVGQRFLVSDISEWLDKYRVFKVEELEIATGGFDEEHLIQGSVYKAYIDGEVFAVKKMKWDACEELKILQKVNHSNLVKLEGFCINSETGDCYLIALDLAHGLQYIHEHTWPRVVHKDIKSSNVLLDGRMRAKIANFGLAKTGHNAVTTHIVGTQGYIAPEYLADGLVTTKMDVFAYGVVLLELVSGREAVSDDSGEPLWADADERVFRGREERMEARVAAWMDPALAEQTCPPGSVASVVGVAKACLHRDPAKRPSMVDVAYTLSKADEHFADYSGESASAASSGGIAAR
uniref:Protein kinase domain-containing protein n=1 Tax=Leersia perrieri TaxID=77586 RepID=A0A0D9VJJ1_9ORYZ